MSPRTIPLLKRTSRLRESRSGDSCRTYHGNMTSSRMQKQEAKTETKDKAKRNKRQSKRQNKKKRKPTGKRKTAGQEQSGPGKSGAATPKGGWEGIPCPGGT